ncbi:MAG: cobyric acid synthase [Desulfobacterales bacterium]|nr:cobyric acid synthase [Desulfobacterales bacterium]
MTGHTGHGAPCLAVFGTGSDVGKSVVATALCRHFANLGVRVAPYKAQNMSNNSGVTPEGLEMGRAQIVQAEACRLAPHVDMNPVLLKPTSDVGAQVVVMGRAVENATAVQYHRQKEALFKDACGALERLRRDYDLVIMEGAGSCAEVNLMAQDIVNFPMAEYADAPVILVADIHRGGVFGQIVGTLACLSENQRQQVAGSIINRFRGDLTLFEDGAWWIEEKTGKPVLGVLPWRSDIRIDPEDSVVIERPARVSASNACRPAVAVIRIPHISNFTDFDPLDAVAGLNLYFLESPQDLSSFDAVILPGSKNTRHDLGWLHQIGWTDRVTRYRAGGGRVTGICGGYQMMGRTVEDPGGLEGPPGSTPGLCLLPVDTILMAPKTTTRTCFAWDGDVSIGYEIHMGRTERSSGRPLFDLLARNETPCTGSDGCRTDDDRCLGTYIHGLFDNPGITRRWLDLMGLDELDVPEVLGMASRDREYDRLAAHFERHVDMTTIRALVE